MHPQRHIVDTLNKLITVCVNSEEQYRSAARNTHSLELRNIFMSYAEQRLALAVMLRRMIGQIGGVPRIINTSSNPDVRQLYVPTLDDGDIVAECAQTEETTMQTFNQARKSGLPLAVRTSVDNHYIVLREAHNHMCYLKDALYTKA